MVRIRSPLVPLLAPTVALIVALSPAAVAPAVHGRTEVPVVQLQAIQLAGIGQDIYNAISPVVQTVVGDVSYLINFVPVLGGVTAAQININYFQGIQPAIAATVDYAAVVLHDPLVFFAVTGDYVQKLRGIGYDLVSAELRFLGFNELPPRPAATAAPSVGAGRSAAASSAVPGDTSTSAVVEQTTAADVPAVAVGRLARPARWRAELSTEAGTAVRRAAAAKAAGHGSPKASAGDHGSGSRPGRGAHWRSWR